MQKIEFFQTIVRPYGYKFNPNWEIIETMIKILPEKEGDLKLSRYFKIGKTGYELDAEVSVKADRSLFLVTYYRCESDNEGGYKDEVYGYDNPNVAPHGEKVDIQGDFWDPRFLTSDLEIVRKAFKTFHKTGQFWMENFS